MHYFFQYEWIYLKQYEQRACFPNKKKKQQQHLCQKSFVMTYSIYPVVFFENRYIFILIVSRYQGLKYLLG